MAFTRVAALLHAALSDVSAAQHHAATVAGDLNLADLANRAHSDLTGIAVGDHVGSVQQVDLEGEVGGNFHLVPSRMKFIPGVAKAWCEITSGGALSAPDYNIASVGDTGVGDRDVNFTVSFSTDIFIVLIQETGTTDPAKEASSETKTTADCQIACTESGVGDVDFAHDNVFFGDQ